MGKKTIAVDVDDVLAAEAEFVVAYSNEHWGHQLSMDDYSENWGAMWNTDWDEVVRRADVLHQSDIVMMYKALEGARDVLEELAKKYKLVILTSRRKIVQAETAKWLNQNFGDLFEEVHYTGFWDSQEEKGHLLTKGQLSKDIGADYLIDDQPKHCLAAAEVGVKTILFGEYSDSKKLTETRSGISRCKDWQSVRKYFDNE